MGIKQFILVFLGGGTGSLIRYLISLGISIQNEMSLPWATLIANISSVFIFVSAYYLSGIKDNMNESIRCLVLIGFCGGLSTFSTFSFETAELFRKGEFYWAIANVLLNNLFCILVIYLLYSKFKA